MNYLEVLGSNPLAGMSLFKATFFTSPAITCFVLLLAAIGLLVIFWLSYGNVKDKCIVLFHFTVRMIWIPAAFILMGMGIGYGINLASRAFR